MDDMAMEPISESIQSRVRKAAPATLIGAAIMLFFGFIYLGRPTGDDWFHRAALVLYYTLRISGLAFVGIGLLLFLGTPVALLLDAVLALPTGTILVVCGLVMLLDGGDLLNSAILIFCGGSFFPTGRRNAQEYLQIRREACHPSPFKGDGQGRR